MPHSFYSDPEYRERQSIIAKSNWVKGLYSSRTKPYQLRYCKNKKCHNSFTVKHYDPKIFCSHKCAAIVNNRKRLRIKNITFCKVCGNKTKRTGYKYCSNLCQKKFQYEQFVLRWKQGLDSGERGINTRSLSGHIRRYLIDKYKEKCSECGWNKRNTFSNKIPLEVDHKDGNSENNKEENLRLLCPNCHSLTSYFRNLNKGNGRKWRTNKYLKVSLGY